MLDLNDLSWQIISAVTRVQPTGRYINKVSSTKFTKYQYQYADPIPIPIRASWKIHQQCDNWGHIWKHAVEKSQLENTSARWPIPNLPNTNSKLVLPIPIRWEMWSYVIFVSPNRRNFVLFGCIIGDKFEKNWRKSYLLSIYFYMWCYVKSFERFGYSWHF